MWDVTIKPVVLPVQTLIHTCICVFVCFSMPFVKCTLSAILVSPGKDLFSYSLMNKFACEKTYFPTKINQKCILNEVSASFVYGSMHSREKTSGNKRLPTLETLSIVLFLLSEWDLCFIVIGGEQGVSAVLSGELQSHGLMLCHWQEQHRRAKRCHFSSCQPCRFVCHFGSSFSDSWTSARDERTSESVRLNYINALQTQCLF